MKVMPGEVDFFAKSLINSGTLSVQYTAQLGTQSIMRLKSFRVTLLLATF